MQEDDVCESARIVDVRTDEAIGALLAAVEHQTAPSQPLQFMCASWGCEYTSTRPSDFEAHWRSTHGRGKP